MTLAWIEEKDPADIVWYNVDCKNFLNGAEIATATFTAPEGLTKVLELNTATDARVKLSGGTAGTRYFVGLLLTTNDGQTFQRDIQLEVKDL
jgi:hypothetical protein